MNGDREYIRKHVDILELGHVITLGADTTPGVLGVRYEKNKKFSELLGNKFS